MPLRMSALGQKQTYAAHKLMSALLPKADITCSYVGYAPSITLLNLHPAIRPIFHLTACEGLRARIPFAASRCRWAA